LLGTIRFGVAEAVSLLALSGMVRIFLTTPLVKITEIAGPAAWISILTGFGIALLQVYLIYLVLRQHPDSDIVGITMNTLGKYAGTAVIIVLVLFVLLASASATRNFSELIIISALPQTPISIIIFSYYALGVLGAYVGLETLARSARITLFFVLGGIALLLFALAMRWDFTGIFPLMGKGLPKVFIKAGLTMAATSEIIIAAVVVQSFYGPEMYRRVMTRVWMITYGLLLAVEISLLFVYGHILTSELALPFYQLARLIMIGRFFQRVESVYIIIWSYVGIIKIALAIYAAAIVTAKAFDLPEYRPLIWPLALVGFVLCFLPPDFPTSIEWSGKLLLLIDQPFILGLPAMLLAVGWLRKKLRRRV